VGVLDEKSGESQQKDIHLLFAYTQSMRNLNPIQVLTVLIRRMEERANTLEIVSRDSYSMTADELRKFARMTRKAREYLADREIVRKRDHR
jgi:hypothetical protein